MKVSPRLFAASSLATIFFAGLVVAKDNRPGPIPDRLRAEGKIDKFYQKHVDAGGLPVVGSERISDNALAEAAWIVGRMLDGRDDILQAMRQSRVRVAVMAADEYTTDLPEHGRLKPKLFWDRRARGLGATPTNPVVSCGEENLLGFRRDPYPNENIFVHEFAHAIHGTGLNRVDPTFDRRLRAAFAAANDRGLWKNTYAATNHSEYWAEGVQSWFDDNAPPDALHNDVRTRTRLKEYDPELAKLCGEVFGDRAWRYKRPAERKPEDRAHLVGYDPKTLPRFRWREAPLVDHPRVTVQTAAGDIELELDAKGAPEATKRFLKIANDGGYHSGRFDRATTTARAEEKEMAGGWIGASVNPAWKEKWSKELELPDLPLSANQPESGTIAMTGDADGFKIFVGSLPLEKVSCVPFGRVIVGADVARKILAAPTDVGAIKAPIDVRRVIRKE
ncbi:peptidylprolyl isomerase [Fimbriiglobus ruber]|uniref:PPIase cyclophilin-type domain-containing protein n=1 Tax=Fimbriiglobus ruber TaxID=1908690 RepID=A0A225E0K9_9BACT|nr:peptidylprolyl isomerase [Fimbriiglobus ruber]OWK44348.1 hypothetical protein FRUB_02280 [Fimbriiglobus ruber]